MSYVTKSSQAAVLRADSKTGLSSRASRAAVARPAPSARASTRSAQLKNRATVPVVCVLSPERPTKDTATEPKFRKQAEVPTVRITRDAVRELEGELDNGASVQALRRFNDSLTSISEEKFDKNMKKVWNELAFNLESFNPVFTATMLKVQCTIGASDYEERDESLRNLIQPLAGEYGMHNDEPMAKTHRKLFSEFYTSVTGKSLEALLGEKVRPLESEHLFACMMRDVSGGGTRAEGAIPQACYALGYNLAVEYLAAYEKTWLLESFQKLNERFLAARGREVDWVFLEIHAIGEPEHAELGHNAVVSFVPETHRDILRSAMLDHDRDFANFYNALADMLEA